MYMNLTLQLVPENMERKLNIHSAKRGTNCWRLKWRLYTRLQDIEIRNPCHALSRFKTPGIEPEEAVVWTEMWRRYDAGVRLVDL
jgi:hypothetical protein